MSSSFVALRLGAIDVGSNGMRLRVVDVVRDGDGLRYDVVHAERAVVRLGVDVFVGGAIGASTLEAAVDALCGFSARLRELGVEHVRAVATSATREATNGPALVERARLEAGVVLETIDGDEEARLVARGVARHVDLTHAHALLVDVGGGSTELTRVERGEVRGQRSVRLGGVRLLHALTRAEREGPRAVERLVAAEIDPLLVPALDALEARACETLVGCGGSVDALGAICRLEDASVPTLDVAALRAALPSIAALDVAERAARYGLRLDRADVVVPAGVLVLRMAELVGVDRVLTPGAGLRDGLLDELAERVLGRGSEGRGRC